MAADLSDPTIRENYLKVRDGTYDWFVLGYGGTRNVITSEKTGTGLDSLKEALTGPVQYVYLKSPVADHYYFAVYISGDASSLLKAKSAVHKRALAEMLVYHHLSFSATAVSEFDLASLTAKASSPDLQVPANDLTGQAAPKRAVVRGASVLTTSALASVKAPEPTSTLPPITEPESEPVKQREPEPEPEPMKQREPEPEPEPVKQREPEPEPEPMRRREPEPEPEPVRRREPEPESEPEPVRRREPEPESEPEPVRRDEHESEQEPVRRREPEPEPEPIREREPERESVKQAESEPEPIREREPEPVKQREPEPVKQAEPQPVKEAAPKKFASEEEELMSQLTEAELAKLLEDVGVDNTPNVVKAAPILSAPHAIVSQDPTEKEEKKNKEREELEALIEKIAQNAREVPVVVNLNHYESLTEDLCVRLGKAIEKNTFITELLLANTNLNGASTAAVVEGLKVNKSITHLNVESNAIGGPGLEAIAEILVVNTSLKELRVANQRTVVGGKPERQFLTALEKNTTLQKLGFSPKDQQTRNQVDKYIFRNKDIARQQRVAGKK